MNASLSALEILEPRRLEWLRERMRLGSDMAETVEWLRGQGYNDRERISFWKTPTTQSKSQNNHCGPYHPGVSDDIAVLGGR